jgi:2-amino-4-hydroxy-6-hydroxymethyldihydropteridine diphosphokinase
MVTAYIALGSNLGDRAAALRAAVAALARRSEVQVAARSPVFETDAVADEPQPAYLNAVVRIETTLEARALLALCFEIERGLGRLRPPGRAKAARTIDLDIVLYGDAVIDEPGLQVPHPAMLERPFVLVPLARVAEGGLRHPLTGERLDVALVAPGVRLSEPSLAER